jgi:hypothetical protein
MTMQGFEFLKLLKALPTVPVIIKRKGNHIRSPFMQWERLNGSCSETIEFLGLTNFAR